LEFECGQGSKIKVFALKGALAEVIQRQRKPLLFDISWPYILPILPAACAEKPFFNSITDMFSHNDRVLHHDVDSSDHHEVGSL
jgi:hypothetical protein